MWSYCHNQATIYIAHDLVQLDRTKHVEIDRHFIKEKLDDSVICNPFMQMGEQLANILTKGVSSRVFIPFKKGWAREISTSQLEGEYWNILSE